MKKAYLILILMIITISLTAQIKSKDYGLLAKMVVITELNAERELSYKDVHYVIDSCLAIEEIPVDLLTNTNVIEFYKIIVKSNFKYGIRPECKEFILGIFNGEQIIFRLKGFRENNFKNLYEFLRNIGWSRNEIKNYLIINGLDIECLLKSLKRNRKKDLKCLDYCGKVLIVT